MSSSTTPFYVTGGTLRPDAPSYVDRQADKDLLEGLLEGDFCYVLTSRQMGKSSLMVRTANRLRTQGIHVIALDLSAIGQNLTPEQWYNGLLTSMGDQLGMEDELEAFWLANQNLSPVQRWFASVRKGVLAQRSGSVVIFLDEIDTVRSLPFSTDEFFAAIRECYNRRSEDAQFGRLTFCLLGVATPSDLIRDTRITPFNIGRRIELNDFTREEASPLAKGLHTDAPRALRLLKRVLHWTRGHPYLTQRLCQMLARALQADRRGDVDRLCEELFFSNRARERDDNLIFVRERMLRSEGDLTGLLELYLKVRSGKQVDDDKSDPLINILRLSGVVRSERGCLVERNRIYHRSFDRNWVRANLPDADVRRQRAAFLRGVIRTTAIAAIVVAAMTIMVVIAARQSRAAHRALALSYFSQAQSRRMSGIAGQRSESLNALWEARRFHTNEAALRDEAIACLALVDLERDPLGFDAPSNTTAVAFSPGLAHYCQGNDQGMITVFRTSDRLPIKRLQPIGVPVSWMALSPDGRFVAVQYDNPDKDRLIVWDAESAKAVLDFTNGVIHTAVDFSADNSKIAIGYAQGSSAFIAFFSLPKGEALAPLQLRTATGGMRTPQCIRFDPAGKRLAESSRASHDVQIWDLATNSRIELFHRSSVVAMAWHPDGQTLATASENNDLYFWDLRFPGKRREIPQAHADAITDLAFSPNGDLLASLGMDRSLKLWTPATGRQVVHPAEADPSGRLHFSQDGRSLGYAALRSQAQLWRVRGSEEYRVVRAPGEINTPFTSLCFSPEGRLLIAANDVGALLWDAATGSMLQLPKLPSTRSAFAHPILGDLFVSTVSGLYRWPKKTAEIRDSHVFRFGHAECFDLPTGLGRSTISGEGAIAVVLHEDHVHLFKPVDPSATSLLPIQGPFQSLAISPDGKWLATWVENRNRIVVWELDKTNSASRPVATIPGSRHFAFSPDGKSLATCWERKYHFWKTASWTKSEIQIPRSVAGDPHGPLAFAGNFTIGGTLLAVADSPATITLFAMSGDPSALPIKVARLESPDRKSLLALAFNRAGSRLAAAANDQTIQMWDLAKIRDELARLDLDGSLPKFPPESGVPLTITFESDAPDTERPQRWQDVEKLTTTLARMTNSEPATVAKTYVMRGQLWMALDLVEQAKTDFEAALRLIPCEATEELIRAADGALKRGAATKRGNVGAAPSEHESKNNGQ